MAKSKIIKEFVQSKVSVDVALRQLKVLLSNFEKQSLMDWVNYELQGYPRDYEYLPDYREHHGVLKGSFLNFSVKATNVAIPLSNKMPGKMKEKFESVRFVQSISALYGMLKKQEGEKVNFGMQIPSDMLSYIQQYSNISMTCLLSASIDIGETVLYDIISSVENKVLDILLLLEKEFGCLDDLDIDISDKNTADIENIQNNIYMIIYDNHIEIGDNNTISKSTISVNDE